MYSNLSTVKQEGSLHGKNVIDDQKLTEKRFSVTNFLNDVLSPCANNVFICTGTKSQEQLQDAVQQPHGYRNNVELSNTIYSNP